MSMQHEYNELERGMWAEVNPSKCPCRGGGWLNSDLDTWHKCRFHGGNVPHPEYDRDGDRLSEAEARAHHLRIHRNAAMHFRGMFVSAGGTAEEFKALVIRALAGKKVTPELWVDTAEMIAQDKLYDYNERRAVEEGYSCGLEMHLAHEAMWERKERDLGR